MLSNSVILELELSEHKMANECAVSCVDGDVKGMKRIFNCIKQFWHRYLLVEPVLILYWTPTLFRFDKFVTYKACRFSLGYNEAICSAVLYENKDDIYIIPYIILMFAGGWADRYNKRKAFLILPILGRCLHYIFQLTSSIYRESLPFRWVGWYFPIIPLIFGSLPCFLMSAFSYITITTPESDRVLRIGILSVFVLLTNFLRGIIGHLINSEFSKYFGICVGLEIAALLYIILFIKEPKLNKSVSEFNDSAGDIQLTNLDDLPIQENVTDIESSSEPSRRNVLKEFFDPMLVIELFKLPFKRRHNNDRLILLLLILCYFLTAGPLLLKFGNSLIP
ncbi:uncharacterized protein LOC117575151 [Drosophila albomicans]|uniref:Uncharacterized protein LOC117575151 n=1 Tax=Drosophila albomicans TaxID=7291 RepID=A0A9C6WCW7_DROAB|nr:uncharacterized protein LOC117575151 [Drosophila albomicans]